MDHRRSRSPSAGYLQQSYHGQSPPIQAFPDQNPINLGLGLESSFQDINPTQLYSNANLGLSRELSFESNEAFVQNQQLQHQLFPQNPTFDPSQAFNSQAQLNGFKQEIANLDQEQSFSNNLSASTFNEGDFSLYSTPGGEGDQFDPSYFLNNQIQQTGQQSIDPSDLANDMSAPLSIPTMATPPHLLQLDPTQHNGSAHQSPSFNQHQFARSPGHSRHASLAPESAAYPQAQMTGDWTGMTQTQFMSHRRSPSEYSDVSASSVTPSPHLGHHESFESNHSPLVNPQDINLYSDGLGIGNFTLSDSHGQRSVSPNGIISPARSPAMSPNLAPQQMVAMNTPQGQFLLNMGFTQDSEVFTGQQMNGQYSTMQRTTSGEMGQAQQMVPPEINVEFCLPSRQNSFEPPKPSLDQDALTPPERGRRRRAASDPFNHGSNAARSGTPSSLSPSLSPNTASLSHQPSRSLSPLERSDGSSTSSRRRQSTPSLPNRAFILGLADPEYQPGSGTSENGSAKRVQKHPATFQCTLCPKRFTRAYNLRSHLRTHTDERPFVCTVCGKAFARQHDRKRHEGLHSGEKKFVCKGELKQGGQWGCGRRFARADALGRHFRSEAGRVCIKPLLDEELIERQRTWQQHEMQSMPTNTQQHQTQGMGMGVDVNGFPIDAGGNYALPAALLAQYPALANISWNDMPQDTTMDDDLSGRSSFDASGSEFYDEADDGGYISGSGTGFNPTHANEAFTVDYSSDYGGR